MHDNPSVCSVVVSPSGHGARTLACLCSAEYTGAESCQWIQDLAPLSTVFASSRGTSVVLWPTVLQPRVGWTEASLTSGFSGYCGETSATLKFSIFADTRVRGQHLTAIAVQSRLLDPTCTSPNDPGEDNSFSTGALDGVLNYTTDGAGVVLGGFGEIISGVDGTYASQLTFHEGRPWYQRGTTEVYWHGKQQKWYVGSEIGSTTVRAYSADNKATPDLCLPTSWRAWSGSAWVAVAKASVARLTIPAAANLDIMLVNSAFQHADDFTVSASSSLLAERSRAREYPITKASLQLPHEVLINPNIPSGASFFLRASQRWVIDVGASPSAASRTVALPRDGLVVYPIPVNLQLPEWEAVRFSAEALAGDDGIMVNVSRTDGGATSTWDQALQLEAVTTKCHLALSAVTVVPAEDDRPAHLVLASSSAIQPGACALQLYAYEARTGEELLVTNLNISVVDCHDRCANGGWCVDDSGSLYDGSSTCACAAGFAGDDCTRVAFVVTWAEHSLGGGVMDIDYAWGPAEGTVVALLGLDVQGTSSVTYTATGLPFGLQINASTGAVVGRPREAGLFSVVVIATLAADESMFTKVNAGPLALEVVECDGSLPCNGGTCVPDDRPYDGEFACDCGGVARTGLRCTEKTLAEFVVAWPGFSAVLPRATLQQPYQPPPPPEVSTSLELPGAIRYVATGLPCGMDVDAVSGALTGVPGSSGMFGGITVFAEQGGRTARVNKDVTFSLEVVDCDNNATCNGGRCVDDVPHDAQFSCNCSGMGKTGDACSVASTASSQSSATPIIAGVAGGAGLLLLLLLLVLIRRRQRRERPYDFDAVLAQMLEDGVVTEQGHVAAPRELPRDAVTLLEELGAGQFGEVRHGWRIGIVAPEGVVYDNSLGPDCT